MASFVQTQTLLGLPAVFHSQKIKDLMLYAQRVAQTQATVLIEGESGTGKELIARAIHQYSNRSQKPWVDVSCGALPEQLMESELFGYEKGAFSGAESVKPGLFELAHQGTLFLDEIGELDPRMQVKLLRVLDGVPYFRLGGTRKVAVDVRVVAATNQNLTEMVKSGRFRNDLYHRLSQITIMVPPLRERVPDILPLAEFFLAQQRPVQPGSQGRGAAETRLSQDARELLESHSWPGNIRELRNAIIKASIASDSDIIEDSDLPIQLSDEDATHSALAPASLDAMEEQMILRALEQTGGHQQRAANILGISRRTLSRKLKQMGGRALVETI